MSYHKYIIGIYPFKLYPFQLLGDNPTRFLIQHTMGTPERTTDPAFILIWISESIVMGRESESAGRAVVGWEREDDVSNPISSERHPPSPA